MSNKAAIESLLIERSKIKIESADDDAAAEWYGHITQVIDKLRAGTMTTEEASEDLGISL